MLPIFPLQIGAGHELAETRVEGSNVVVLQIHLNKGFPVVGALVLDGTMEGVTRKIQIFCGFHAGKQGIQIGVGCASAVKMQAIPRLNGVVAQIQAGIMVKMRGADQCAGGAMARAVVSPAMQRADDIALCLVTLATQHDRLAMAADVGDQLNAIWCVHQHAALMLLRQRVVVANTRHTQRMSNVGGRFREDFLLLGLKRGRIKVAGHMQRGGLELQTVCEAQVGHVWQPYTRR